MPYLATITDKRQLTIPAGLFRELNLSRGDKLVMKRMGDSVTLTPAVRLVERAAGMFKAPKHLRGRNIDELIEEAKYRHFALKYRHLKR